MPTDKKITDLPIATFINTTDLSVLVDSGTDYQYNFTLLLQFLEANLTTGANIAFGSTLPQNTSGSNGDVFINTSAGSFAQKVSGTWVVVYTLPAANAADGTLLYGAGLPGSATGKNADSYINTLTGVFYQKLAGSWSQVFSMATGPQGPQGTAGTNGSNGVNGNTVLFGSVNPSNSTTGNNGDFYINTSDYNLFGPKTAGAWGNGTSLIGAQGIAGAAGPQGPAGATGASGATGAAGPQGETGATGPQGPAGVTGPQGPAGAQGPAGSGGSGGAIGYTTRDFDEILTFDVPFKMITSQTSDIAFILGSSPVADVIARITITGDGTHACTFSSDWVNANGQVFDNMQKNIIYFEYDGVEVLYSIVKVIVPDTIAPYIVSAVINNTAKNQVVLTYSEPLNTGSVPAIGDFSANSGKAVTAVAIAGSVVTVTMSSNYLNTDTPTISYTPGGNPIQDPSANDAVALVNYAVVNNVLIAGQSAYITVAAQKLQNSVLPTNMFWSNQAGADVPVSRSFWIKRNNTNNLSAIYEIISQSNTSKPDDVLYINNSGTLQWSIGSPNAAITRATNVNIVANTWNHVVLTYDGSGIEAGMLVYINGVLVSTYSEGYNTYVAGGLYPADTRLTVFGRFVGYDDQDLYNTQLSSLYFWNKLLTQTDVTALYNSSTPVDPTTLSYAANLVGRYEFNGAITDSSSSGYNLSSTQAPTYIVDIP